MAASVEDIGERLKSLFQSGGRYQVEKLMTIGVYIALCVGTLVWVLSVEDGENELGASHGFETLAPLNQKIFFLENDSGDAWTNVRIVLNKDYLFTTDRVAEGERLMLRPEHFRYFWWVPRPWGRHDWEALAEQKKRGEFATEDLSWESIEVRAREGRLDLQLGGQ